MRYSAKKPRTPIAEIIFLAIGVILLLILGVIASGQTKTETMKVVRGQSQVQQPTYREYRGVHLGMTAAKLERNLASR